MRLYSGPAYQPLNTFLRQIAPLTDDFRRKVAQHPDLTFSATVGHICRAIRKLAAVTTPEEAPTKLFRGVRGDLEKAFWIPDAQGMVVRCQLRLAVDLFPPACLPASATLDQTSHRSGLIPCRAYTNHGVPTLSHAVCRRHGIHVDVAATQCTDFLHVF